MKFLNLKQISADEVELRIEGDIISSEAAWIYEWFGDPYTTPNEFRKELEEYKGKNITVWINSNGGDVIAGSAIYTALKEFKGKKTVKIDGAAISAASVIAMAGDEILMSPTSLMMIHNPWTYARGDVHEFMKEVGALNAVKEAIINAYESKTKLQRKKISELMDSDKWMSPQEAIELGFADGHLYEDNEKHDYLNMISGAKIIFNSVKNDYVTRYLEKIKMKETVPEVNTEYEQARINLELSRF